MIGLFPLLGSKLDHCRGARIGSSNRVLRHRNSTADSVVHCRRAHAPDPRWRLLLFSFSRSGCRPHTLTVMAGPVPAIRASAVVRRWPGQGPAMTVRVCECRPQREMLAPPAVAAHPCVRYATADQSSRMRGRRGDHQRTRTRRAPQGRSAAGRAHPGRGRYRGQPRPAGPPPAPRGLSRHPGRRRRRAGAEADRGQRLRPCAARCHDAGLQRLRGAGTAARGQPPARAAGHHDLGADRAGECRALHRARRGGLSAEAVQPHPAARAGERHDRAEAPARRGARPSRASRRSWRPPAGCRPAWSPRCSPRRRRSGRSRSTR